MEGKELTARGKVRPVAQADDDNQGLARWFACHLPAPPPEGIRL